MSEAEKAEEDIIEERIYTVSFGKQIYGRKIPRMRRAPRAMRFLRAFARRHMKTERIVIDPEVNEAIFSRGIQKPPRKLRVRIIKTEEDVAEVFLA